MLNASFNGMTLCEAIESNRLALEHDPDYFDMDIENSVEDTKTDKFDWLDYDDIEE